MVLVNPDQGLNSTPAKDGSLIDTFPTDKKQNIDDQKSLPRGQEQHSDIQDAPSYSVAEVFSVKAIDPVLAKKMALVNESIDSIGMTGFHWRLFALNGFGYAVDSVLGRLFPAWIMSVLMYTMR